MEKEQIVSNNICVQKLEKLYFDNRSSFYEVVEHMPLLVTISRVDDLNYKFCNDAIEDLTHMDKGFILEYGWSVIKNHIHPENLKYQALVLDQYKFDHKDNILNYLQYVRRAGQKDYYWIQTHKKFLTPDTYISVYYDLTQLGKVYSILKDSLGEIALSSGSYLMYESLTKREKEILQLVAKGYSSKELSELLFLSEHTIKTHRKNISAKLGIKSSTEWVKYAQAFEMIEPVTFW